MSRKTRGAFSPETRQLVLRRSREICEYCGKQLAAELHHRLPRGMGGVRNEHADLVEQASNAIALCRQCHNNFERHDRLKARELGIILSKTQKPADEPLWSKRYRGWVVFDDDGNVQPTLNI